MQKYISWLGRRSSLLRPISWRRRSLDPLNSLAHLPNSLPLLALLNIDTLAVLLALAPFSDVFATVGPLKSTMPVLLIVLVAAYISTTITPSESSLTLHLIIDPLTVVDTAVRPSIFALAMDIILEEVTFVCALV